MLSGIFSHEKEINVLSQLLQGHSTGRSILLTGKKGTGKFTIASAFAQSLFNQPRIFSNPDFSFYRNDQYLLKTRFFLEHHDQFYDSTKISTYLSILIQRLSLALSLNEIKKPSIPKSLKKKYSTDDIFHFMNQLNDLLRQQKTVDTILNDKELYQFFLDLSIELDKKKVIPISFTRELIRFQSTRPTAQYKFSIIADFENATTEAQNSALKLFEEPPEHSFIIITSSAPDKILTTIRSRCITIPVHRYQEQIHRKIFHSIPYHQEDNLNDLMYETVYQTRSISINKISQFIAGIAPTVQNNDEIFNFCSSLTDHKEFNLPEHFITHLIQFFRLVHLQRQTFIRNIEPLDEIIQHSLSQTVQKTASILDTDDIINIQSKLIEMLYQLKNTNISTANILPDFFIDLSRLLQMRGIRKLKF